MVGCLGAPVTSQVGDRVGRDDPVTGSSVNQTERPVNQRRQPRLKTIGSAAKFVYQDGLRLPLHGITDFSRRCVCDDHGAVP